MYGSLNSADCDYGGTQGKRWKLDWDKVAQPIEIKLKTLRGVRDKLPGNRRVSSYIWPLFRIGSCPLSGGQYLYNFQCNLAL